jgi:hypothetical protein
LSLRIQQHGGRYTPADARSCKGKDLVGQNRFHHDRRSIRLRRSLAVPNKTGTLPSWAVDHFVCTPSDAESRAFDSYLVLLAETPVRSTKPAS